LFSRSQNIELKRFLLRFVFKRLTLTEGKLTYELNFPFSEFETTNLKKKSKEALELVKPLEIKGFQGICNKNIGNDNASALEPQNILKKQEVRHENLTSVQSGWRDGSESERKSAQIYSIFVSQHDKILAMNEQVLFLRGLLAA